MHYMFVVEMVLPAEDANSSQSHQSTSHSATRSGGGAASECVLGDLLHSKKLVSRVGKIAEHDCTTFPAPHLDFGQRRGASTSGGGGARGDGEGTGARGEGGSAAGGAWRPVPPAAPYPPIGANHACKMLGFDDVAYFRL